MLRHNENNINYIGAACGPKRLCLTTAVCPLVQKNHPWQTAYLNAPEFTKDYSEIVGIQCSPKSLLDHNCSDHARLIYGIHLFAWYDMSSCSSNHSTMLRQMYILWLTTAANGIASYYNIKMNVH